MVIHADVIVLMILFIVSLLTWSSNQKLDYLRFFPLFLFVSLMVELVAAWIKSQHHSNTYLYNLYTILEFSFYFFFLKTALDSQMIKKQISIVLIVFPILCLVNFSLIQGPYLFNTYTFTIGTVIIDLLGICYFLQLFKSNDKIKLFLQPPFWIITGLLFFYTSSLSFFCILNYVASLPKSVTVVLVNLMIFVNVLLYLLFLIAHLCRINFRKTKSKV